MSSLEVLPLAAVLPDESDAVLLKAAVDILVTECMAAAGLEYLPYPLRPPRNYFDIPFRYGEISPESAVATGYRSTLPTGDPPEFLQQIDQIDRRRLAMSSSYNDVLYGAGDNGCMPIAESEVYGGRGGLLGIPGYEQMIDLTATSFDQMRGSEEAESVQEDWVRCMADEGFDLEDWQSAALRFLEVGGEVTSQERLQAQADSSCRSSVRLVERLLPIEIEIQNSMIESSAIVADFRTSLSAATERARLILE